jgi:hypothetical protein
MNAALVLIGIMIGAWLILSAAVVFVDQKEKRRHAYMLEVRDWQEKVDAMRRLQDEEGQA